MGASSRLTPLPAAMNTMSTSEKSSGVGSSTVSRWPLSAISLPTERSDAHRSDLADRKAPLLEDAEEDLPDGARRSY